ncbi:hypothetical protein OHB05_24610 [Streptomyces sp. NBC_00638]|uniref:hypothetical protein n=1 Tax=unclassified Streptomyces TaxID=2593676 RepID=UPI002258E7F4|nr:hypothetical protein [Streptomyces sp. NBC_00638]MCX5005769.1 hypothetical protein [Streptomyces sp. NBC_00638]
MPVWLFLMLLGLAPVVAGGWIAFNMRGAADAIKAFLRRGHEMRALAAGDFTPSFNWVEAVGVRAYAAAMGVAGFVLVLAGAAELLTGG